MKRIVASIGVAALGAACVQSANAQGDGSKPWAASLALRGFYDDNVNTVKHDKIDTFGYEINPSLAFALKGDQTTASLIYTYGYKYYEQQPSASSDSKVDQTHTIAASLVHSFDARTTLSLSESFVIGQEPDVLRAGPDYASFQRISGQNVRNYASITLNHQFKPTFGVEVGYVNSLFNYEDDFYQTLPVGAPFILAVNPVSQSGILDRVEQAAHIDARWTLSPKTIGLIGYAFNYDTYTADQPIGVILTPQQIETVYSDSRDSRAHYVYVGAEEQFRADLHGSLRVGARFTDYFNSPSAGGESSTSPYLLASLNYNYAQDCSLSVGLSHDLSATDAFSIQGDSITSDSAATVFFASLAHRIMPRLTGTLMGQFQNSTFRGGEFDEDSEQYVLFSAALEYQFNRHISASVSYHYDLLESDVPDRGYSRNRIFLGTTITY